MAAINECPPPRAYVTFLQAGNDSWKGVVGLAKSLRMVRSAYPLVVTVLPDVPEEHRDILVSHGCVVREIQPVYAPPESQMNKFAEKYYANSYSMLLIWEFEGYERMVYLDPGVQVHGNIDELFELPEGHLYAVMDCFCKKTWTQTPQYKVGYCQQCPEQVPWPTAELGPPPALYFNAGVFVLKPSMVTAMALLDNLGDTQPAAPMADFLNMFFKDCFQPLEPEYNFDLDTLFYHPENLKFAVNAKVVHTHRYAAAHSEGGNSAPLLFGNWLATKAKMFGSWLATEATMFARQRPLTTASLAASRAASGMVSNAANPAICFAFYVVIIMVIIFAIITHFRR